MRIQKQFEREMLQISNSIGNLDRNVLYKAEKQDIEDLKKFTKENFLSFEEHEVEKISQQEVIEGNETLIKDII